MRDIKKRCNIDGAMFKNDAIMMRDVKNRCNIDVRY
jgi:hypothetical protein